MEHDLVKRVNETGHAQYLRRLFWRTMPPSDATIAERSLDEVIRVAVAMADGEHPKTIVSGRQR
jgi:hypothetical protein